MIDLEGIEKVILYPGVTDMRWGIPGLIAIVGSPLPNTLYVFCGSHMKMLKILLVESDSYSLYARKLKAHKYLYPALGKPYETDPRNLEAIIRCASLVITCESNHNLTSRIEY